jgi:hypothetical protein
MTLPALCGLGSCKKDDDHKDPIDQLPPATQTGAGTFAALVDGKPFIADNPWFNCFYQYVDGEYYFGIQGRNNSNKYTSQPSSIALGTIKLKIQEGKIFELFEISENNASGGVGFTFSINDSQSSSTNSEYTGELNITKLDFQNYIVSGTFWFDIQHPLTGKRIKIREGRFDTLFTQ